MSGQVWKLRLPSPNEEPFVVVPKGSRLLHVAAQDGIPYVWALVFPEAPQCRRHVAIYATGQPIDGWPDYLGTFHIDWTVLHVFTTPSELPLPAPVRTAHTDGDLPVGAPNFGRSSTARPVPTPSEGPET